MTEESIELYDLEDNNYESQCFNTSIELSQNDEKFNALIEQDNSDSGGGCG
jgi:hypothetical protein